MSSFLLVLLALTSASAVWAQQKELTVELSGEVTMEFVWTEPGKFLMGSPDSEPGRLGNEGPQHEVTITRGFYLGKYEITQAQWESVMGTRPWVGKRYVLDRPDCPAVYISWFEVQEFLEHLNLLEGKRVYRLPTEAEWEYACRAGTTSIWSFGDDVNQLVDYAWWGDNAWSVGERYAHPVGTRLPNPWGLYDMHGNVWEWTQDWLEPYSGEEQVDPTGPESGLSRVVKGGYFDVFVRATHSAARGTGNPLGRDYSVGARIVRQDPEMTLLIPQSWGLVKINNRSRDR